MTEFDVDLGLLSDDQIIFGSRAVHAVEPVCRIHLFLHDGVGIQIRRQQRYLVSPQRSTRIICRELTMQVRCCGTSVHETSLVNKASVNETLADAIVVLKLWACLFLHARKEADRTPR